MTTTPNPAAVNYLKRTVGTPAFTTIGFVASVVLGSGLIMALVLVAGLMLLEDSRGLFSVGLGTILVFLACVVAGLLGAGWAGNGDFSATILSAEGSFVISAFSLTTLTIIAVGTVVVAKKRLAHDPLAPTVALAALRAALEGMIVGLAFMLVFGFLTLQTANIPLIEADLHGRPLFIFLSLALVVSTSLFVTRERARPASPITALLSRPLVHETRAFLATALAVFVPLMIVGLVVIAVDEGVGILLVALPFLVNVLLALATMGYLGGLALELPFASTDTHMAWDMSPWFASLVFVFAALSIIATAISVGLHRPRSDHFRAALLWRLPVGAALVWLAITLTVLPVRLTTDMGGYGTMKAILTVSWWAPFTATAVAFAVSVLAEFAPRWAYLVSPTSLRFFAPKQAVERWIAGRTAPLDEAAAVPETEATPEARAEHPAVLPATAAASETPAASLSTQPQQDSSADEPLLPLPERTPLTPQKKRRITVALVIVLTLFVAVGAALVMVKILNANRGPEAAVENYLTLVSNGKLEAATEAVDPGVRNTERSLLTSEVYDAADHGVELVSVRTSNSSLSSDAKHASVKAEISIDGERQVIYVEAERGANTFGVLHNWQVTTPLVQKVTFEAPVEFESLEIGGTTFEVGSSTVASDWDQRHRIEAYLYPGEYTFSIPDSEYFEFGSFTVTIAPQHMLELHSRDNTPLWVEFEANPSEALQEAVLEQVNTEFTKCVTIPTNMENVCPSVVRNDDLAVLELGALPDGFEEFDVASFTTKPGTVKTQRNSTDWMDFELKETEVWMSGTYSIVDGKIVLDDVSAHSSFWNW